MTTSPILLLDNVSRVHGHDETAVRALDGVTLTVHAGELVAVMGPSGTGKVFVEGADVGAMSLRTLAALRRRSLGFVFQDFNLIPSLTAAENVALPLGLDGLRVMKARRIAMDSLETVGIPELADRYPEHMSGGQQQRVAIARALVGNRRLVLADEPTGALDSQTGEAVLRVLRARCDAGAGGLLVTHEARHAAWADRVVFLRDGVVVDSTGTPPTAESLLDAAGVV
jgi:putative ABC transport system ATP-binding protein